MPTIKTQQYFLNEKRAIFILLSAWAIVQVSSFLHFGIVTSVDSSIYINNGLLISQGQWLSGNDVFYSSYCLVIACLNLLGLGYEWIVLLQVFLSGTALVCLYKLTYSLSKKRIAAFITGILYILWIKFMQWNLIVYTDSMFTHLIIISILVLLNAKTKFNYLIAFLLIVFTTFLRPTGIGFLVSIIALFLYMKFSNFKENKIIRIGVCLVVMFTCLFLVNTILKGYVDSFLISYSNAEVIYPNIPLLIQKPKLDQLYLPDENHHPIIKLFLFVFKNPIYILKLSLLKGALFLGHIKPYYSLLHNLWVASFLYPIYLFAIKGGIIIKKHKYIAFFIVFIGFQVLTVSLTSENWDGRFLLPVLPWFFILSGIGMQYYYSNFFENPQLVK